MKKIILLILILSSSFLMAKGSNEYSEAQNSLSIPKRIISLSPSTTEILFAIGAGDQIVGVTSYCDYPEEAKTKEQIGGFSSKTISIETIISLNPDLVIAGVSAHQPIADTLRGAGIVVLSIEPKTLEGILSTIEELAIITGHEINGKTLAKEMRERLSIVNKKLDSLGEKEKLRVFYEVWDAPLMTAGPHSFTGQILSHGGGINIFSDVEADYPQVSSEELISRNPQAIVSSDTHNEKLSLEAMAKREGWQSIDAFKNNNIILLDGNILSRPGPRVIDAIEMIASALYPDLF